MNAGRPGALTLFLAGDVMTGRGVDQVLPSSVPPDLHEPYVKSAETYVRLAEEASGPIPAPVAHGYVWGDALAELERARPHARVVNLETAVTLSDDRAEWKGIHYRMHPDNVRVLTAAQVDVCVLGNNHVLDWGTAGLVETLEVLETAGLATAGAGRDGEEAGRPAVVSTEAGRLLVFSYASPTSGVPGEWAAGPGTPGVRLLPALGAAGADRVAEDILAHRREGDRVVVSVHWGGNWGYDVPDAQQGWARALIDAGAADVVHGHSSHHPKRLEIHQGRLILYGCGDFINDYEGIGGRERFRSDLTLMYLPTLEPGGELAGLVMVPFRMRRFRLERASDEDAGWLAGLLDRESRARGAPVRLDETGRLRVEAG